MSDHKHEHKYCKKCDTMECEECEETWGKPEEEEGSPMDVVMTLVVIGVLIYGAYYFGLFDSILK